MSIFDLFKKENNPKISIVIISYNVSDYIEECLRSVLSQKLDKEVICIDDCSTDKTFDILSRYANEYSEIKLCKNDTNMGTCFSRYKGLELCSGDFMLFVDGDDTLCQDTLPLLYKDAQKNKADILEFVSDTDSEHPYQSYFSDTGESHKGNLLKLYSEKKIANALWNKLISKRTYKRALRLINPELKQSNYSDVVFFLFHFLHNAKKLVYSNIHGYFYYGKRGITTKNSDYERYHNFCDFYITKKTLEEVYGKNNTLNLIWNKVCNQAVFAFLALTPEEQDKYKPELYKLTSEKNAEYLISEYKKREIKWL